VLTECEIGGGRNGPHRHDDQRADHHPECDRSEPHLAASIGEGVSGPASAGGAVRPLLGALADVVAVMDGTGAAVIGMSAVIAVAVAGMAAVMSVTGMAVIGVSAVMGVTGMAAAIGVIRLGCRR